MRVIISYQTGALSVGALSPTASVGPFDQGHDGQAQVNSSDGAAIILVTWCDGSNLRERASCCRAVLSWIYSATTSRCRSPVPTASPRHSPAGNETGPGRSLKVSSPAASCPRDPAPQVTT